MSVMGESFSRAMRVLLPGVIVLSLLAGCSDQRNQPECGDVYKSRIDENDFEVFEGGMALHRPTGLIVTQCAVGQRMSNFRCRGSSLKLSWDEAMAYAREVAEKTGDKMGEYNDAFFLNTEARRVYCEQTGAPEGSLANLAQVCASTGSDDAPIKAAIQVGTRYW